MVKTHISSIDLKTIIRYTQIVGRLQRLSQKNKMTHSHTTTNSNCLDLVELLDI